MMRKSDFGAGKRMRQNSPPRVFFGGGRRPAGVLAKLLRERIEAVPPGGTIDWVTYYFRDRDLAKALLRAQRRGVKVTVTMAKYPRTAAANQAVIAMLGGADGLGRGFRALELRSFFGSRSLFNPRLHEKLYCFSHPFPTALIGSFNPSGDRPEAAPEIIAEIGDHDSGYNLLVELSEPELVAGLVEHARRWQRRFSAFPGCLRLLNQNCRLRGQDMEIFFWPRLGSHPLLAFLQNLGPATEIRLAASHLRGQGVLRRLVGLARSGYKIEIIAGATERRVPESAVRILTAAGIRIDRVGAADGLPMHDKFVLLRRGKEHWVSFGSFNWTMRSWYFNHEIGAISSAASLYAAFDNRWQELKADNLE